MGLSHTGLHLMVSHAGDWGDGTPLPGREFDGATGGIDVWSPRLAANFDGNEGAVFSRAAVATGAWTDGVARFSVDFRWVDNSNRINVIKHNNNNLSQSTRLASGTSSTSNDGGQTTLDYKAKGLSFSNVGNYVDHVFFDGSISADTATAMVNTLTQASIGDFFTLGGSGVWHGTISHVVTFFEALDASQRDAVWSQLDSGGITPAWIEANISDNFVLSTLYPDSIVEDWGTGTTP